MNDLWPLLLGFLGAIFAKLIVNQVEALVPILARWIVLWVSRQMGSFAERSAKEWLDALDATPGALFKLGFALNLLPSPLWMTIERWRDRSEGFDARAVAVWLKDLASFSVVIALVLLVFAYPLAPTFYAAYTVVVPFLLICGCYLSPHIRRRVVDFYDRSSYRARIGVGGLAVPVVAYFLVALSFLPLHGKSRQEVPRVPGVRSPVAVLVQSLPVDGQPGVGHLGRAVSHIPSSAAGSRTEHQAPSENRVFLPVQARDITKVQPFDFSKLPVVIASAQVDADPFRTTQPTPPLASSIPFKVKTVDESWLPAFPALQQPVPIEASSHVVRMEGDSPACRANDIASEAVASSGVLTDDETIVYSVGVDNNVPRHVQLAVEEAIRRWNAKSSYSGLRFRLTAEKVLAAGDLWISSSIESQYTSGCARLHSSFFAGLIMYDAEGFGRLLARSEGGAAAVLVHEFGHFLGLAESEPQQKSVMSTYDSSKLSCADLPDRELTVRDAIAAGRCVRAHHTRFKGLRSFSDPQTATR